MKIFEFQFNPKAKKDTFFKVFSFEPDGKEDRARGSLHIVGELENALPSNGAFLGKLASKISDEYYAFGKSAPDQPPKKRMPTSEASLKNALKKANEFLGQEAKKGNVDWLGNLHFTVIVFVATSQGHIIYFTKVGGMKIWMARHGSLVDVGKNLEHEDMVNQPTKVFGNIGSGRVVADDRVFLVTKDLFEFFVKTNLLQTVSQMQDDKQFKNLFKEQEKQLADISGILYLFIIEAPVEIPKPDNKKTTAKKTEQTTFALPIPQAVLNKIPSFTMPKISVPHISIPHSFHTQRKNSSCPPSSPS